MHYGLGARDAAAKGLGAFVTMAPKPVQKLHAKRLALASTTRNYTRPIRRTRRGTGARRPNHSRIRAES